MREAALTAAVSKHAQGLREEDRPGSLGAIQDILEYVLYSRNLRSLFDWLTSQCSV